MGLLDGWKVYISWHEKGFWQADLFDRDADTPEAFFTLPKGRSKQEALAKAFERWPYAEMWIVEKCEACAVGPNEDGEPCDECQGEGALSRPVDLFVDAS